MPTESSYQVLYQSANPNKHPLMPDAYPWKLVKYTVGDTLLTDYVIRSQTELNAEYAALRTAMIPYRQTLAGYASISPAKDKVKLDREFGASIYDEFSAMLRGQSLSVEDTITILQSFASLKDLLFLGSIEIAMNLIASTASNATLTFDLKTYFVAKIARYLEVDPPSIAP